VFVGALLGAEIAAVVLLHRLGRIEGFAVPRRAPGHWLLHAQTEELVAVTARVGGLALAWWLLVATLLSLARRIVPGWRSLRALDWVTPVALRHLVDRVVAVGLGASLAITGIHPAGATARRSHPAGRRVDVPVVRSATTATPATPAPRPPNPVPVQSAVPSGETAVVVRAGDNLWVIAHRALGRATNAEIAPYWSRVIAANTGTLRSHDPDLIFPGERVLLPLLPPPEAPAG
jgi:nucleoid-associated protein YgaU